MKRLAATDLIRAWEAGLARPRAERALAILAAVEPRESLDDLAALPLGRRDARLRELREATFGSRYDAVADCPCGERLALSFDAAHTPAAGNASGAVGATTLCLGDYTVEVRPLDTTDLLAAAQCADVPTARTALARRTIRHARRGDVPVPPEAIPGELFPALAAYLEAADPDADTSLAVTCPACGRAWDATIDVADYLWTEIEAEALRLLRQVDCLARGYGWCEADILALSPFRRRAYVELVQA